MIEWTFDLVATQMNQLWSALTTVWNTISSVSVGLEMEISYLSGVVSALGSWIKNGAGLIKAALAGLFRALAHLNFASIWNAIKRIFDRFRRALRWYQQHVQAPIDRLRRTIMDLYNRFFRPILRVLDSFRVFIRMLAIFDRRLAAKLDAALFGLESKLMYPITAMLKRLNELSSYTRAIITATGLLDRVMTLETLRRDASLVWEVLTNPRSRIYGPIVKPEPRPSVAQTAGDIEVYAKTGAGPMLERMDALDVMFQQAQLDVVG